MGATPAEVVYYIGTIRYCILVSNYYRLLPSYIGFLQSKKEAVLHKHPTSDYDSDTVIVVKYTYIGGLW